MWNSKWNFHIHQKETQDGGSENKTNTTAFQVVQKEVPNQAGFLPGCSTSPQFLKPSNSTKTWSILSYRRVCASPLHTAHPPKLQEKHRNPIRGQILSSSLEELEGKKRKFKKKSCTGIKAQNLLQEFSYSSRRTLIIRVNRDADLHPSWRTETL